MTDLLAGWTRTRSVTGVGPAAGRKVAVPTGTAHAVEDSDRSKALCGTEIVAVGPPWPRGLGGLCVLCKQRVAER
jgi:hypothetical protein